LVKLSHPHGFSNVLVSFQCFTSCDIAIYHNILYSILKLVVERHLGTRLRIRRSGYLWVSGKKSDPVILSGHLDFL